MTEDQTETNYNLQLTKTQFELVQSALEVQMRLNMGQFDLALEQALNPDYTLVGNPKVAQLKQELFPELESEASYGIGSENNEGIGRLYTLYTSMRHFAFKQLPTRVKEALSSTVDADRPLHKGDQPFPKITKTWSEEKRQEIYARLARPVYMLALPDYDIEDSIPTAVIEDYFTLEDAQIAAKELLTSYAKDHSAINNYVVLGTNTKEWYADNPKGHLTELKIIKYIPDSWEHLADDLWQGFYEFYLNNDLEDYLNEELEDEDQKQLNDLIKDFLLQHHVYPFAYLDSEEVSKLRLDKSTKKVVIDNE